MVIIERVIAVVKSDLRLDVAGEGVELGVHRPYPPHLININKNKIRSAHATLINGIKDICWGMKVSKESSSELVIRPMSGACW